MNFQWRPTLRQLFALSLLGLLLGLGLLFYLVIDGSQKTILQSSDRYRKLASRVVADRVSAYLQEAPDAVADFEKQIQHGLIDPKSADAVEQGLLSLLIANPNLSEATLTYADSAAYGTGDRVPADPKLSGQVAVLRAAQGDGFVCKLTWYKGKGFVAQTNDLSPESLKRPCEMIDGSPTVDPTEHPTFQTAVLPELKQQLISTDLHWAQIDETLPTSQRRVELSVQKSINDAQGKFAGVIRIGLMKTQIDGAVKLHITAPTEADPHVIFICDNQGRVVTAFQPTDRIAVSDDDLRIDPGNVPPVVARALQDPKLKTVEEDHPATMSFDFEGRTYLSTFSSLPKTQDWIVGIVVPRDFYLGQLVRIRDHIVWASLALIAALLVAGSLVLRMVARAQWLIRLETARMNDFQFEPSSNSSHLRDVAEILSGLERAKTAMRAMSKYVPINLVRQLYCSDHEPALGAEACELSVLFTDIKDFTSISEKLPEDQLAKVLGDYLEAMTGIIQGEKGTIDKYIGDAIMAFWNAPDNVEGHEVLACRAAIACRDALQKANASTTRGDAPHFETRFGLHRCVASVGHFGAPDRFNYTAIGDGINLASRLEGLNKYYGTTIIASEMIREAAKEQFDFRLLDRVAVKGKSMGVAIYELVGERKAGTERPAWLERYEQGFALYQKGDFAAALEIFSRQPEDPPSQLMATRCREFIADLPAGWTGVHNFDSK